MGSLVWISLVMVIVTIMANIPDSLASPFSSPDTIFKPWKVRASTSYNFDKKPSLKEKKMIRKVSHSPPIFRSAPRQSDIDDQEPDWSAAEMMQRPIDEPEIRKTDRGLGSPCSYSSDCSSSCCLLDRSTKIRSCQPKGRTSDRCSNFQVKGDLYVDACPCARGTNHCSTKTKRCSW